MNNSVFAICGTVFFVAFAVITAMYGGPLALPWVTTALFLAGLSQFFAQGPTEWSQMLAWISAFFAMAFAAVAIGMTFGAAYYPVTP